MPTNPLSTVGLMLTLASLIGSFFYLQLSQWLRDVVALRQKTELNVLQGDEGQQRAIVECKVEIAAHFLAQLRGQCRRDRVRHLRPADRAGHDQACKERPAL